MLYRFFGIKKGKHFWPSTKFNSPTTQKTPQMNSKHLTFECAIITITSKETYLMFTTKSFLVLYPTINCCFASCSPNRRHIHWAIKRHCNRPNNTNSSVVFYSKFSLDYCFYPAVPQFCSTTRTVRQKTKRNQQNLRRLTRYKLTAKW